MVLRQVPNPECNCSGQCVSKAELVDAVPHLGGLGNPVVGPPPPQIAHAISQEEFTSAVSQARGRVRVGEEGYHSASLGPPPPPPDAWVWHADRGLGGN